MRSRSNSARSEPGPTRPRNEMPRAAAIGSNASKVSTEENVGLVRRSVDLQLAGLDTDDVDEVADEPGHANGETLEPGHLAMHALPRLVVAR